MSDVRSLQRIGSLQELDQVARQAADNLSKASGRNAILDKALKALKPNLADLDKVFTNAKNEADQADGLIKDVEAKYDSKKVDSVRKARNSVDLNIMALKNTMSTAAQSLQGARNAVVDAEKALDDSAAGFDQRQKDLLGLPRQIQEQQKALAALEAEVRDAYEKNQLVEAVVKLDDLKKALEKFKADSNPNCEVELWKGLDDAVQELLRKTDELSAVQVRVLPLETAYNEMKASYDNAQKNRLDDIKQRLADEEKNEVKPAQKSQKGK